MAIGCRVNSEAWGMGRRASDAQSADGSAVSVGLINMCNDQCHL